jgi:CheY-like chemotaxis protein
MASLESGADGYLTQPIEAPVLAATVRALLRKAFGLERLSLLPAVLQTHARESLDVPPTDRWHRLAAGPVIDASGLVRRIRYQVAQNPRSSAAGDGILPITPTGDERPEDWTRALEAGFDVHRVKPHPDQLQALLADAPVGRLCQATHA